MSWNNSRCINSNYPPMMDSEWRDAPFNQNDWDWITSLETKKSKKQLYLTADDADYRRFSSKESRNRGIK